jgi:hypothetical protein
MDLRAARAPVMNASARRATRTSRHGIAEPILLMESIRSCIELSSDTGGTASTDDIRHATEWAFKVKSGQVYHSSRPEMLLLQRDGCAT